jgi:hypothetical protein
MNELTTNDIPPLKLNSSEHHELYAYFWPDWLKIGWDFASYADALVFANTYLPLIPDERRRIFKIITTREEVTQ